MKLASLMHLNEFNLECSLFLSNIGVQLYMQVKFIYSAKATKFCKISTVDLSYVVQVKSTVEISQNISTSPACIAERLY